MITVVAALIPDGDRFLVTQRMDDNPRHPGEWEVPGGKVEPGESETEALVREISEELDVRIEVIRPYVRVQHEQLDFSVHLARIVGGTPRCVEVQRIEWMTVDQAEALTTPAVDRAVFSAIRRLGLK
ncbi:MAG: NUDIX domain-containing protein [Proteobacteria bacterium]|nr:NUDIX domain-containing protein [Pseudomonadota bacterium]